MTGLGSQNSYELAERVERFVRDVVVPVRARPAPATITIVQRTSWSPSCAKKARAAGVLTPHILCRRFTSLSGGHGRSSSPRRVCRRLDRSHATLRRPR